MGILRCAICGEYIKKDEDISDLWVEDNKRRRMAVCNKCKDGFMDKVWKAGESSFK